MRFGGGRVSRSESAVVAVVVTLWALDLWEVNSMCG